MHAYTVTPPIAALTSLDTSNDLAPIIELEPPCDGAQLVTTHLRGNQLVCIWELDSSDAPKPPETKKAKAKTAKK